MDEFILNLNNLDNFYLNNNNLCRQYFTESNNNLLEIIYDQQGYRWSDNDRERNFKQRRTLHKGYRCVRPISIEEKKKRNNFHKNKKEDIFFQYKNYFPDIQIKYAHFQVRKNFHLLSTDDNQGTELIYNKRYGIESLNLITKKIQTLCFLSLEEENDHSKQMICFDVMKNTTGDYIICLGKTDGSLSLYNVSSQEIERVKEFKSNVTPKFDNYLSTVIAEGNSNELLTCHVKFINYKNGNYLLTTCNDGQIKIFDTNNSMKLTEKYKSESPVNHCDFNHSQNILGCVGDSRNVELFDTRTQHMINKYLSHNDYGTCLKFQPKNDYIFATGNQDYSCKIWDTRKLNKFDKNKMMKPIKFLSGYFENIGDLTFTKNSNEPFLLFAENSDYLHIYNMNYDTIQTMSYLGGYCGMAYEENSERIYLGIDSAEKSGIISYDKIGINKFNDIY